jgi:hypothetical protein
MKYRVVKRPMWKVVGDSTWMGYSYAFVVQKKGFLWGWNDITYSVTREDAYNKIPKLKNKILTDDMDEVV